MNRSETTREGRFERRPAHQLADDGVFFENDTLEQAAGTASAAPKKRKKAKKKGHKVFMVLYSILTGLLIFGFASYIFLCCIPGVNVPGPLGKLSSKFQTYMISNSRESFRFQWVQYFFPQYVRDPYITADKEARQAQQDFVSKLNPADIVVTEPEDANPTESTEEPAETLPADQLNFYELFWELDQDSMESYLAEHPSVLEDGYDHIYINEAGLNDDGTDIYTKKGEQVLAIDAENQILLIRVKGDTYRGVLATAKDPSRLHLYTSKGMSTVRGYQGYGQTAGTIASNHNGILAITGSGFIDPDGNGTGGALVGYCRSDGESYGEHRYWGCKRLELRKDNWLYLTDTTDSVGDDVTNAMEFEPGMIADGVRLPNYVYTMENPRACLGQSDKGEILMLGIEGRFADSPGCSVSICTDILLEHRCITAMNMDGGTSAMLWFDGEPVIRCSNVYTPEGRYLPNAWVYVRAD